MPLSSTTQHQRIVWGKATTSIVNSFIYCHGRTQGCLQSAWHPQLGDQFANLWGFRRCAGKQTWIQFGIQDAQQKRRRQSGTSCDKACAWNYVAPKRNALIVQLVRNNTHTHFCFWTLEEDESFIHQETSKVSTSSNVHIVWLTGICALRLLYSDETQRLNKERSVWYSSSHLNNSMASSWSFGWTRGISLSDGRFEGGEEELILNISVNQDS